MKKASSVLIFILIAFLAVGGCGDGSGNKDDNSCDFDIRSVLNGDNLDSVDSIWNCESGAIDDFEFAIFENGTGFATNIEGFTWEEAGCRSISIESGLGDADIADIDLSDSHLTFILESEIPGFNRIGFGCEISDEL